MRCLKRFIPSAWYIFYTKGIYDHKKKDLFVQKIKKYRWVEPKVKKEKAASGSKVDAVVDVTVSVVAKTAEVTTATASKTVDVMADSTAYVIVGASNLFDKIKGKIKK